MAMAATAANSVTAAKRPRDWRPVDDEFLFSMIQISQRGKAQSSSRLGMSDRVVTAQAAHFPAAADVATGVNRLHDITVTTTAGILSHVAAKVSDLDVVREIPRREVQGMKKSVASLDCIFTCKIMGSVAVVAT